jgi:octaprenyl-diphosphate synthase
MELSGELERIYDPIKKELQAVEKRLYDLVPDDLEPISTVEKYILDNGGKRLRPALVLLASKVAFSTRSVLKPVYVSGVNGGLNMPSRVDENENSLPDIIITLAAIAELIHTATLVHDDLMSGSLLRRGRKTVNAGWGEEVAVLLGDHLYLKATELLTSQEILDPDRPEYSRGAYQASNLMLRTTSKILKGEILQYQKRNKPSTTEEEYFSIIEDKTASFISACCKIGALLDENTCPGMDESLASYGFNLGIAFQIRDDILDIMGNEEKIGKEVGSDLREGRMTLPLIHLMENTVDGDKKYLESTLTSLYDRRTFFSGWRIIFSAFEQNGFINKRHLQRIRKMLLDRGSINYSLDIANGFINMAKKALENIPDSNARQSLMGLAHYVMTRDK